jgi:hypothetical protein
VVCLLQIFGGILFLPILLGVGPWVSNFEKIWKKKWKMKLDEVVEGMK